MKALVYQGIRKMSYQEWPDPSPGLGEALVAIRAAGICGSDLHGYAGESTRRVPPMVMGHEATGEIITGVDQFPSRRVVIQPILNCGQCEQCLAGHTNRCLNRGFVGGTKNGAMADRIALPVANLRPLRDSLDFVTGTLVEPLSVALHAVRQAGDIEGKSVLIVGSGPIGLLTLITAKSAGAGRVIVMDLVPYRRDTALALGADSAIDPSQPTAQEELTSVFGTAGADIAFDAVGVPPTFAQAILAARRGGTVIAIGGWQTVPIDLQRVVSYELNIRGTMNYVDEFDWAIDLLANGLIDRKQVVTHQYPMSEGAAVFDQLANHPSDSIKVVLTNLAE